MRAMNINNKYSYVRRYTCMYTHVHVHVCAKYDIICTYVYYSYIICKYTIGLHALACV